MKKLVLIGLLGATTLLMGLAPKPMKMYEPSMSAVIPTACTVPFLACCYPQSAWCVIIIGF